MNRETREQIIILLTSIGMHLEDASLIAIGAAGIEDSPDGDLELEELVEEVRRMLSCASVELAKIAKLAL